MWAPLGTVLRSLAASWSHWSRLMVEPILGNWSWQETSSTSTNICVLDCTKISGSAFQTTPMVANCNVSRDCQLYFWINWARDCKLCYTCYTVFGAPVLPVSGISWCTSIFDDPMIHSSWESWGPCWCDVLQRVGSRRNLLNGTPQPKVLFGVILWNLAPQKKYERYIWICLRDGHRFS